MDWLEEWAEKLKQYIKDTTLVRAVIPYLLIAMLGSLACSDLTVNLTSLWINVMTERVPMPDEEIQILKGIRQSCPYFFMAGFLVIAGRFYVENKIKAALSEIRLALKHMAAGDLSFEVAWQSGDEFGMLARDVENLRETLKKDKLNQWKMGEEQRKINAAFAHDIRTPLTVMNGYTEFLKKYVPQGKVTQQMLLEKLDRILAQGDRLLSFSRTMTTLQTMEKREARCRQREATEICGCIRDAAEGMKRGEIGISLTEHMGERETVLADLELIMETVENLLQNAFRYAREKVEITVQRHKNKLIVYVRDDGEGFSEKALIEGDAVYFREGKAGEEEDGHFGIGLSIARMLSEKHGGELRLFNSIEGGAVAAVSFFIGE